MNAQSKIAASQDADKGYRAYAGEIAYRGKEMSEAAFRRLWNDPALTKEAIGRCLGISSQAVSQRAQSRGLPARPPRTYASLCVLPVDEFRDMWLAGVMTRDIIAHFGCSHLTPKNTARRLGLPLRGRSWQHRGITIEEYRQVQLAQAMADEAKRREDRLREIGRRLVA